MKKLKCKKSLFMSETKERAFTKGRNYNVIPDPNITTFIDNQGENHQMSDKFLEEYFETKK